MPVDLKREVEVAESGGRPWARWLVVGGAALLAGIGIVGFWGMSQDALLRVFSCDDSFYYSAIARELATHGASTFDGRTATNGYQPLWTWLQVPVFWGIEDAWNAVRATRSLEVLIVLAGCLAWLSVCWRAGVATVASVLMLPFFVQTHDLFIGMEAGASVATLGCAALAVARMLQAPAERRMTWSIVVGIALAASALARLDNLAFAVAVSAWLVARRATLGLDRRAVLALLLPQLILLGAYFVGNFVQFGTAVPVSGLVKQWWSSTAADEGLARTWRRLVALLGHRPAREGVIYGVVLAVLVGWRLRRRPDGPLSALAPCVFGLIVLAVAKVGYYAVTVEPELANYGWYFVTGTLTRQLALVVALDAVIGLVTGRWAATRACRRLRPWVWPVMLAVVALQSVRQFTVYHGYVERDAPDWEMLSFDGSRWLAANVPHTARVGSFDAGVLGYFAPQAVTNLDGLVDSLEFLRAGRAGEPLLDYLDREQIDYIANVVADPVIEFPAKGIVIGDSGKFAVLHVGARTAFVDGAERRFVVLERRR